MQIFLAALKAELVWFFTLQLLPGPGRGVPAGRGMGMMPPGALDVYSHGHCELTSLVV